MIGILLVMPQPRVLFTLVTLPARTSLPVPVRGVPPKALADTWGAPRSDGRHRRIDAIGRERISAEIEGMTLEEELKWLASQDLQDPFLTRLRDRVAQQPVAPERQQPPSPPGAAR